MSAGVSLEELLNDNEASAKKWEAWFRTQPAALDVPCDIYNSGTVRGLLKHLWAVELRHSQRLLGEEVAAYDSIPASSMDELIAVQEKAATNLRAFVSSANEASLAEILTIQTLSKGVVKASRRKLCVHVLLHSMRHWAQLSTMLRQHGYPTDWTKDFLFSDAMA